MMTGHFPCLVWSGLQPSGIWNCTYIWPIMIWFAAVPFVAGVADAA